MLWSCEKCNTKFNSKCVWQRSIFPVYVSSAQKWISRVTTIEEMPKSVVITLDCYATAEDIRNHLKILIDDGDLLNTLLCNHSYVLEGDAKDCELDCGMDGTGVSHQRRVDVASRVRDASPVRNPANANQTES